MKVTRATSSVTCSYCKSSSIGELSAAIVPRLVLLSKRAQGWDRFASMQEIETGVKALALTLAKLAGRAHFDEQAQL